MDIPFFGCSFVQAFICTVIYSFVQPSICSFAHSFFAYSFVRPFVRLFMRLFAHFTDPFIADAVRKYTPHFPGYTARLKNFRPPFSPSPQKKLEMCRRFAFFADRSQIEEQQRRTGLATISRLPIKEAES